MGLQGHVFVPRPFESFDEINVAEIRWRVAAIVSARRL
jgi:hypothetical protein